MNWMTLKIEINLIRKDFRCDKIKIFSNKNYSPDKTIATSVPFRFPLKTFSDKDKHTEHNADCRINETFSYNKC